MPEEAFSICIKNRLLHSELSQEFARLSTTPGNLLRAAAASTIHGALRAAADGTTGLKQRIEGLGEGGQARRRTSKKVPSGEKK